MSIDDVISVYVGKVVNDKVHLERHAGIKDWLVRDYEKQLVQDELVLRALKCAKANGLTGED